ncbi:GNAT family N-acetyltransferase [Bacillus tianshenii]|nr:GNAT family N-acetyltransferase [Bacillus tianshenii]
MVEVEVDEAQKLGMDKGFEVPAIEIMYIGINENYQNQGIGTEIIKGVIGQALEIAEIIGCRYVFLWAVPKAIPFYERKLYFESMNKERDGLRLMRFLIPEINFDFEE